jgi:hypothetical protein
MTPSGLLQRFGPEGGLAQIHSLSSLAVDQDFIRVGWRIDFPMCQSLESIVPKASCDGLESALARWGWAIAAFDELMLSIFRMPTQNSISFSLRGCSLSCRNKIGLSRKCTAS